MPKFLLVVFQLISAATLLAALYTGVRAVEFMRASRPFPGIVTRHEPNGDTYYSWVDYSREDAAVRHLRSSVGSSPPAFAIGEHVMVRVGPDGEERIDSFSENWFLPLFFSLFALAFGGFGFGPAWYRARKIKQLAYLKEAGASVIASSVEVAINHSYSVNNRHPWFLKCKALIDGTEREFKSASIWRDPAAAVEGKPVRIWYLPRDPRKYQVDLAVLDEDAPGPT